MKPGPMGPPRTNLYELKVEFNEKAIRDAKIIVEATYPDDAESKALSEVFSRAMHPTASKMLRRIATAIAIAVVHGKLDDSVWKEIK